MRATEAWPSTYNTAQPRLEEIDLKTNAVMLLIAEQSNSNAAAAGQAPGLTCGNTQGGLEYDSGRCPYWGLQNASSAIRPKPASSDDSRSETGNGEVPRH